MPSGRTAVVTVAVTVLTVTASPGVLAQSASSNVQIFRAQQSTLDFPGTGSSTFSFASGSFTQGGGTASGTASAGQGSITAFASAGEFGANANSVGSMSASSRASLSDSFRITADADAPLKFDFGLRASGNVSTIRSGGNNAGTASASVEWNVGLSGGAAALSASGRVSESYRPELIGGVLVQTLVRTETGLSFNEFALVADVGSGVVGQTFSLNMSAIARAGYSRGVVGSGTDASGTADFGSTLRWLGLRSVTFADGTPYTGTFSITSASGFDYTTPTPGAASALLAGAAWLGSRRRR